MANRLALVVDDSKTARVTLKRMLENHGVETETVDSARAAIDYLVGMTPAVIFMSGNDKVYGPDLHVGICGQNMNLAAQALGLGFCWSGFGAMVADSGG